MAHRCLLCDPEEGDGTDPEVCEEFWDNNERALEIGCCMPDRCLCPHPDHAAWECFDIEMAEAAAEAEEGPCL